MPQVKESSLWKWLKQAQKKYKKKLHMERIENGVGAGKPDVDLCFDGFVCPIELKSCDMPKKDTTKVKVGLRKTQAAWFEKRISAGGKAFVLVQISSDKGTYRLLIDGVHIKKLQQGLIFKDLLEISEMVNYPEDVIALIQW